MEKGQDLRSRLEAALRFGSSFDLLRHDIKVAGVPGSLFFIDGFANASVLTKLEQHFVTSVTPEDCVKNIPYIEVEITDDPGRLVNGILSGQTVLVVDGVDGAAMIDTRQYPQRSIKEPENDRVLRGPREGFTETLLTNTTLIRRRIRDPELTMRWFPVGTKSRTDVVISYLADRADMKFVKKIEDKLKNIDVEALSMGQESLEECLIRRPKWNPFPKIRYSERPDAACAMLMEGSVIVICDGYPAVMILPTSIFDFIQESDDFYFPPLIGTYIRLTRCSVFLLSLLLTPTWYLLITHEGWLPEWMKFILVEEPAKIPVLLQLLLAEFAVDGLKFASLNTPDMLNNSLSIVGALILGDFAVQTGWFCQEVILYMAIVAIAAFTQQSYELGYAFKFLRILNLIMQGIFGLWGYVGMMVLAIVLIPLNKTVDGSRSYLYPIIPFNARAFKRLIIKDKH